VAADESEIATSVTEPEVPVAADETPAPASGSATSPESSETVTSAAKPEVLVPAGKASEAESKSSTSSEPSETDVSEAELSATDSGDKTSAAESKLTTSADPSESKASVEKPQTNSDLKRLDAGLGLSEADRTKLLEQTNSDLKRLDAELGKIDGKVRKKEAMYTTAAVDIGNQLGSAKNGGVEGWTKAANKFADTLESGHLDIKEIGEDRRRVSNQILDPLTKRLTEAGLDSRAFLKGDDVYKLKTDDTATRDLAVATQKLAASASEMDAALTEGYKESHEIRTNPDAIKATERLIQQQEKTAPEETSIDATNRKAQALSDVFNDAKGTFRKDDPKWDSFEADQAQYKEDMKNVFKKGRKGDAEGTPPPSNSSGISEKLLQSFNAAYITAESYEDSISEYYKAAAGSLDAQDFQKVEVGDSVNKFINGASHFLQEVNDDFKSLDKFLKTGRELSGKLDGVNSAIILGIAVNKLDQKKLENDPAVSGAVLDEKLETQDMTRASVEYLNSLKGYTDKVNAKAQEFLDNWDKVKSNARNKENFAMLTIALDLVSGFGIGANAGYNLLASEAKAAGNSIKDALQAVGLRQGQLTDMLQVTIAAGRTSRNFATQGVDLDHLGMLSQIDESIARTLGEDGALAKLKKKIEDHKDWLEDQGYEGLSGF
jgi:hypothetical protein